jgi:hypothetical protein
MCYPYLGYPTNSNCTIIATNHLNPIRTPAPPIPTRFNIRLNLGLNINPNKANLVPTLSHHPFLNYFLIIIN